jgi:selenocysteine lyase/cysteine desulfurase
MAAIPLPVDDPLALKTRLYDEYRVEVPMGKFEGRQSMVRVSFQAYNDESDLDALVDGLKALL